MMRIDWPTAQRALAPPRPPRQAAEPFAEERVSPRGAVGGLGAVAAQVAVALALWRACGTGPRTGGRREPGWPRTTRWPAVGNRDMSSAVSAMMAIARLVVTPGISASRAAAGRTAAPGPGSGAGLAGRRRCPRRRGWCPGRRRSRRRGRRRPGPGRRSGSGASAPAGRDAPRTPCPPATVPGRRGGPAAGSGQGPRGGAGRAPRSMRASMTARAVMFPASFDTTDDSLTRAPSRSFSSRCHCRVRSRTRCTRARVKSRSARI